MSRASFPGGSSSRPPSNSNSNSNINDDIHDDELMAAEYERRWAERHSEENHAAALAAALARHTAIRERAINILEVEQLREENERIREEAAKLKEKRLQLEERNRVDTERAMEAMRIQEEEKKAREIPKPQPSAPTPSQAPIRQLTHSAANSPSANQQAKQSVPATSQTSTTPNTARATQEEPSSSTSQPPKRISIKLNTNKVDAPQQQPGVVQGQTQAQAPTPRVPPQSFQMSQAPPSRQTPSMPAQAPQPQSNITQAPTQFQAPASQQQSHVTQGQTQAQAPQTAQASSATAPPRHPRVHPSVDRYIEIHKELKQVRKAIKKLGDENAEMKKVIGDMRRTINRTVGQLTQGGNNKPAVSSFQCSCFRFLLTPAPVLENCGTARQVPGSQISYSSLRRAKSHGYANTVTNRRGGSKNYADPDSLLVQHPGQGFFVPIHDRGRRKPKSC